MRQHLAAAGALGLASALCAYSIAQQLWAVTAVLLALPFALLWPVEIALGAFAFLVPFDLIAGLGTNGSTVTRFVGIGAGAVLIVKGFVSERFTTPPKTVLWWMLFVFWCLMTYFWALDPRVVSDRMPTLLSLTILFIVAACFRITREELHSIELFTVAGGVAAALYAIWGYMHGASVVSRATLVANDTAANPNDFATTLIAPLALSLGLYFASTRGITRMLGCCSSIVVLGGILLTMSRGALLAVFVVFGVFVFRLHLNWRVFVLIAALAALVMAMPTLLFERVHTSISGHGAGRFDIWQVGIQMVRHYGFLGAGLGNFPTAYDSFAGYAPTFRGFSRAAHNTYLAVFVEMGALGLLLFVGILLRQARGLRAAIRETSGATKCWIIACEAAFFGVLTHGLAKDLLFRKALWLVLILAAVTLRSARTKNRSSLARRMASS